MTRSTNKKVTHSVNLRKTKRTKSATQVTTAPLLGGTETSVYGAQDGTPSGRQRAGCVFSTSLTGSRNRQALVGPAQVNSNGVNSNVLTPTLEDRHLAEGNHARTGDKSDSKYSGQAADWPDQKYKVDQEQGNPGKGLRVENAARSVQPICIRAKHVPSILRRHKPQKFHHYKQQQQQQHPRQQQEEHPVGISEHTPTDRKLSRKNRHEMKEDSESDSSANMASSTPRPLAHSSTDGNASDNESSRMPGPVHLTVSERQVRVGSNDSDENSGSINVDNLVSVKICSAVSADKTTEKNCITTKDAQIVAAKSQPQPATELSDLSRSVSDNTSTGKTATSGTSNISRPPLTSDATAVTIATTTITTSAFTVSESKLNTLGTSSPDYRGVFSCQSAAPGGVAVTSPCHVGENYAQKSARGGCEVMKSTANQRSSGGKTSRNGLGEQRVLATDRYALDDANYNIIAEKYRLFYSQPPRPPTHDTGSLRCPALKKPKPTSAKVLDRRKKRKRKDCIRCGNATPLGKVARTSNDHDLHLEIKFDLDKGKLQVNNNTNNLDDILLMKKISP